MQNGEDYNSYIDEGGCDAFLYKLRKKRGIVVISLMLVAAVVAAAAGLYYGITKNEYSNMALAVGIWFPSIIVVIICVYIAITCVQGSSSSRLSPIHSLPDERQSHICEDVTQHPERNRETPINMHARCHPKVDREPTCDLLRGRTVETKRTRTCDARENPSSYCRTKMYGRHFRSLSNSDITRYHHRKNKMLSRGSEMSICSYGRDHDNEYSIRHRGHQDVPKPIGFKKRSVSDTAYKYKNAKSREEMSVYDSNSLDIPRRYKEKQYTVVDEEQNDYEYCDRTIEQPITEASYPVEHFYKNNKASRNYETEIECNDYMAEKRRYIHRNRTDMCVGMYSSGNVKRENAKYPFTKPEMPRFYPSSLMEYLREYGQSLHFPYPPIERIEYLRDNRNAMDFPSEGSEQNGYLFGRNLHSKSQREKYVLPQKEVEITDHEKRKAIYFPFPSRKESNLQLPRRVPEDGSYLSRDNKMKQRPLQRNEENVENSSINDKQAMTYPSMNNIRSQSVGCLTRNNENNPQEIRHSRIEYPVNRNELVERQMSSLFQKEHPSKDIQACEVSTSNYRENIRNLINYQI